MDKPESLSDLAQGCKSHVVFIPIEPIFFELELTFQGEPVEALQLA